MGASRLRIKERNFSLLFVTSKLSHDPRVVHWLRTAAIVLAGVLIGAGRLQHAGHARRGPTEALLTRRRSMPHFFTPLPLASFWWREKWWLVFVLIVGRRHSYSVPMSCLKVFLTFARMKG